MDALSTVLYNAGCQSLSGGHIETAERLFQLCLEHDPGNYRAKTNLVFCLGQRGALYRGLAKKAIETLRNEDPLLANYRGLYQGVLNVLTSHVTGDVAEFGTDTGRSSLVLAAACADIRLAHARYFAMTAQSPPKLHLFDSFEGLPDTELSSVDQQEPSVQTKLWAKGTCAGLSEAELRQMLAEEVDNADELTVLHKGWFSDTIPRLAKEQKFALLHIDCDLYSSTCDVLDGLFGRQMISEGAHIFFDDWWCNRGATHLGEQRAWSEAVSRYDISFSDRGDYGPMSRAVIVHSYRSMPVESP